MSFDGREILAGQKIRHSAIVFVTWLVFSLFTSAFIATPAWSQGDASIRGTLSDATGSAIAGGTIKVKNIETGLARTLVTDEAGRYEAPPCPWANTKYRRPRPDFNPRKPK